jgi:predicted dehydrogenase
MSGKVRVAVIGCGKVSRGHIPAWLSRKREVDIVGLYDPVRRFCVKRRKDFGLDGARIYDSYAQALDDRVDVINLCSMSDVHDEQIMKAMEAGKHVLTEKPTGYSLEMRRKLRWYAGKYPDLKVGVAYSLRYIPINIEVRRLIQSGAVGRPMWGHVEHCHRAHGPMSPPDAGPGHRDIGGLSDAGGRYVAGSDMTHATHPWDLARYMMGEPSEVDATRNACAIFGMLTMTDKSVCQVQAGSTSRAGLNWVTPVAVQGTEGTVFTQRLCRTRGRPEQHVAYLMNGARKGSKLKTIRAPKDTGHGDHTRTANFLAALRGKEPLICPLEDSIRTSELLHAVWESCTLGIRVGIRRAHRTG